MKFDALVIGGGPGGSTTALILARAGWSVAMVEKSRFPRQKVCGEFLSATNAALLRHVGMAEEFADCAGPSVNAVGLFAGETILTAPMPQISDSAHTRGRALGRDQLDARLLRRAADAGAVLFQPCLAAQLRRESENFICRIRCRETGQENDLWADIVIAAHGSWETGQLPTQPAKLRSKPGDLFGFKARFNHCSLPAGLMPLLVFPGGYGGMVHTDGGRTSLSSCISRDYLEKLRDTNLNTGVGAAVLSYITHSCRGVRDCLADARLEGPILSAGPIRPGIRRPYHQGIFSVGNAAGEAHPLVAEGISMAMQAAWLLTETLLAGGRKKHSTRELDEMGNAYSALWKVNFRPRIRAAACFAHLAMRPVAAGIVLPFMKLFPQTLALGARWGGKTNTLVLPSMPAKMAAEIQT